MPKTLIKVLYTSAILAFLLVLTGWKPQSALANALEKYANQPLNALAKEDSPYLRNHSRDLVNWNAWNKTTLEKAEKSGKPVFLSIGYSACHWCHVMQEESFNNPEVAKLMNEYFTPILIDREQRPDLDETYMLATEAISGQGGWPNNILLTPQLKPFYGGVYFPPSDYIKLLTLIAADWSSNQAGIELEAERISTILVGFFNRKSDAKELTAKTVEKAAKTVIAQFDTFNGGIGTAPKHFNAPILKFLVHVASRSQGSTTGDAARQALLSTLDAIANGGVRDHLAGGFHRYAIDNNWRTPHFEKMLYDQAMLAEVFTKTAAITGQKKYELVARSTLNYVLDDFTSPQGGFYSTRDADSEGEEGIFYVWTPKQLAQTVGEKDAAFIQKTLGLVTEGEFAGKVIIYRNTELSKNQQPRFEQILKKLLVARAKRIAPHKDKKILASWNGLMISAFSAAGTQFKDPRYSDAATKAAEFIWTNMRTPNGELYRTYFEGKASIISTLPDYALLAKAFIDVYDMTADEKWLKRAEILSAKLDEKFRDKKNGDYFFTATKQGYGRIKLRADTALPSGNAAALEVFEKLSRRSLDPKYSRRAEAIIAALSGDAVSDPKGGATALASAERYLRGETGPIQYAARGRVSVKAEFNSAQDKLILNVKLAPEWHVNANKPFEKDFIPTSLVLKTDKNSSKKSDVIYPKLISRSLGFHDRPLALYESEFQLIVPLAKPATSTVTSELTLQACNNQVCLIPETLTIRAMPTLSSVDNDDKT